MRLFVFFGGLIVLALLAALVGPYFVDWDSYKNRFEAEATRILGQEVRVEGDASARLLPFPSVTFSDVRVGPSGLPNITVEEFSMDAELAPFLSGEILIFDMRFVSPVIRLDLDEAGRPVWDWPSEAPVDPAQITLESASFVDGTIILRDPKEGRQWDFVSLNGTAAAPNMFGPWRVTGEGLVRGEPFEARVTTGNLDRVGFSTRITAILPNNNIEITTEGRIEPPASDQDKWYSGTFSLKPTGADQQDYLLEGLFEADARSLTVQEFRGDFGSPEDPYTINGSASITGGEGPRFNLEAKGNQITIAADQEDASPLDARERIAELQSVLAALPFPPIPGTINLDLPAVVAGNTTIRDVKLSAEPAIGGTHGTWNIKRLNAKLPGRTVLEATGELDLALQGDPVSGNRFVGDIVLASRQPSGLAGWLTNDVDESIRFLPYAGVSAAVDLSSDRQSLENLELIVGSSRLTGRIGRRSDEQSLPYLDVELTGTGAEFETLRALYGVMFGSEGEVRTVGHDVDVKVDLRDVNLFDVNVGRIDSAFRVRGERVEIDRISVSELFGAGISATATVQPNDDGSAGNYSANWDVVVITPEGAQFLTDAAERFSGIPFLNSLAGTAQRDGSVFRDASINIVGTAVLADKGNIEASASVSGGFGGSEVSLTSTFEGQFSAPETMLMSVAGTVNNQEASVLLSQAGFKIFPIRLLGEGQTEINVSGRLNDGLSTRVALQTPDSLVSGTGIISRTVSGTNFDGVGRVYSDDAEPWMDLFGYIFPDTGLGTPLKASARVTLDDSSLSLSDLTGDIADNRFEGSLKMNRRKQAPDIQGSLELGYLDVEFVTAFLTGRYDLTDGDGLFSTPLYSNHVFDLELEIDQLAAIGGSAEKAKMRLIFQDGALSVRNLDARFAGGTVSGSVEAQNSEGTVLLNSQLALDDIELTHVVPVPGVSFDAQGGLSVSLTGTGKSTQALLQSLTGSGVLNLEGASVPGINLAAIAPILNKTDAIGYEISDSEILTIVRPVVVAGDVAIPASEMPISINGGRLSIDNFVARLSGLELAADLSFSLPDQLVSGDGRIVYDPGIEEVAGAQPEIMFTLSQEEPGKEIEIAREFAPLVSFIRQRSLEKEQARVEALQARLLEKQRLRRSVRYMKFLRKERLAKEEEYRMRELGKRRRDRVLEESRRREAALLEAEVLAKRLDAEQKTQPQPDAGADRGQVRENANSVDRSLLADPLVPVPNAGNIFNNLEFKLSN